MHLFLPKAKGVHDHPKPEAKSTAEARKSLTGGGKTPSLGGKRSRDDKVNIQNFNLFVCLSSEDFYPLFLIIGPMIESYF